MLDFLEDYEEILERDYTEHDFHLDGIIPIFGNDSNIEMPWHNSMMPISNNFLLIDKSVYECSIMGCSTIWIVCPENMQPLIKHRVGEWVDDYYFQHEEQKYVRKKVKSTAKSIPIFYVPIRAEDKHRNCLSWSILYGSLVAYHISKNISRWSIPDKYFISFPHSIYDYHNTIFRERKNLEKFRNVKFVYKEKSIQDNLLLPFIINGLELSNIRKEFKKLSTIEMTKKSENYRDFFSLDKIFSVVIFEQEFEVNFFHDVSMWENYVNFLRSQDVIEKPKDYKIRTLL